jgi:hypothetical protein
MNLFSKGKGLMGALRVNGVIANNTQTTKTTVTTLTDAPETLTAAMVVTNGGLLAGTPSASRAKTVPTGTLTCAALAGYKVGDTFEVKCRQPCRIYTSSCHYGRYGCNHCWCSQRKCGNFGNIQSSCISR